MEAALQSVSPCWLNRHVLQRFKLPVQRNKITKIQAVASQPGLCSSSTSCRLRSVTVRSIPGCANILNCTYIHDGCQAIRPQRLRIPEGTGVIDGGGGDGVRGGGGWHLATLRDPPVISVHMSAVHESYPLDYIDEGAPFKPYEKCVTTRKCQPDAGADALHGCESQNRMIHAIRQWK
ncbi:hypothetical protein EJB05_36935, partial [Eragrostis curvula]